MIKGLTQLQIMGDNRQVDPFGNNAAAAMAYKQMERLVTATHMVTNYVPNREILKGRVRDIASTLLTDTMKLRDGFTSSGINALSNIIAQVRLILSLLDTLYASGMISKMNLRILKDAYIDFSRNLESMATARAAEGVELTKEYFLQTVANSSSSNVKIEHSDSGQDKNKNKKKEASMARINAILDYLSKRDSAGTGDLAQVITNCSSKTLQRDLMSLVKAGKIKKFGHKRWTKYSLT
jgi:hypothetical protein